MRAGAAWQSGPGEEYRVGVLEIKVHDLAEDDGERHALVELHGAVRLGDLHGDLLELHRLKVLALRGDVREAVVWSE